MAVMWRWRCRISDVVAQVVVGGVERKMLCVGKVAV